MINLELASSALEDAEKEFWDYFLSSDVANPDVSRHPSGEAVYVSWQDGLKRAVYASKFRGQKVNLGVIAAEKHSVGKPKEKRATLNTLRPDERFSQQVDAAYGLVTEYDLSDLSEVERTFL